ncbi:hypothetical protein ACFE04_026316 [Oxalis oulophora]
MLTSNYITRFIISCGFAKPSQQQSTPVFSKARYTVKSFSIMGPEKIGCYVTVRDEKAMQLLESGLKCFTIIDSIVMALATDLNDMSDDSFNEGSLTSPPTIPPSFRLMMTLKLATGTYPVQVDEEFVAYHPDVLEHSVIVINRLHNRSEYPCHVIKYQYGLNAEIYLGTGWHNFCTLENIRSGDILQFVLLVRENIQIFNVHITRSQT